MDHSGSAAVAEASSRGKGQRPYPVRRKGRTRLDILRRLPQGERWDYFKDQIALRLLAAVVTIATIVYLAIQILIVPPAAKLYVAVIDDALAAPPAQQLQEGLANRLKVPEGKKGGVLVDSHFTLSSGGLTKLQTMLGNREIDAVIADRRVFAQLAGYGYFAPLTAVLGSPRPTRLTEAFDLFPGYDDSQHADPFYDGSGHGARRPYGLNLNRLSAWRTMTGDSRETFLGVAQNSTHTVSIRQLVSYVSEDGRIGPPQTNGANWS